MPEENLPEQPLLSLEIDPGFHDQVDREAVVRAVNAGTGALALDFNPALSVVMVGDERIRELNAQYRGVDAPTDVLAFPADFIDPDLDSRYLGDILISVPRAASQAEAREHSLTEELQLLVVHGLLHLAGYDHLEDAEKAEMWDLQARILEALGVAIETER
jgi:probable rRNA maturation factor